MSRFGIQGELSLEVPIVVVAQVARYELCEERRFDELHLLSIRKVRIDVDEADLFKSDAARPLARPNACWRPRLGLVGVRALARP